MTGRLNPAIWVVVHGAACGCSVIGGFDDLHSGCPPDNRDCAALEAKLKGGAGGKGSAGRGGGAPGGAGGSDVAGSGGRGPALGGAGGGAGQSRGGTAGAGASAGGLEGGAAAGATAGDSGANEPACVDPSDDRKGAAMARVLRGDGSAFLIDRTEVTNGEYAEFLATKPPLSDDPLCPNSPNTGQTLLGEFCTALFADGGNLAPELPRVCVDWCDADAYCKWAGKELCPDTASNVPRSSLEMQSDFYAACAEGSDASALFVYGCGSDCGPGDCNGKDSGNDGVLPVGTRPVCKVGAAECLVADLSGNVEEWTKACDPGTATGNCVARGGSFDSDASELQCDTRRLFPRRTTSTTLGFRCCVDPE